eukprot:TRINITY_DN623_c0_g2_i1.p1 TRINITY_DN623_c0_g2~~TRINITY_DN623_c0_g2_i1.p1  ORF type:complete len:309 (+),score=74.84 TRINITY_DN623_c0_g2_i1:138-1064(+)
MGGEETPPTMTRRLASMALVAAGFVCATRFGSSTSGSSSLVFVAGGQNAPLRPGQAQPLAVAAERPSLRGAKAPEESQSSLLGFCGAAVAASLGVAGCQRAVGVAMNSQGQGGRGNWGQFFMPTIKGARKMVIFRRRKNYGSHQARRVPRRYPLYDKLEEYDDTLPVYTVVSEPEKPKRPKRGEDDVRKRYPWAGEIKANRRTVKREADPEERLEPYFANYVTEAPPPQGYVQNVVHRRGWPRYNHPPWINKPLMGQQFKVPNDMEWKKNRQPEPWQYSRKQRSRKFPTKYDKKGFKIEQDDDYDEEE